MTQKLLLAESLDLLRQAEFSEYEADKRRQRIEGSNNTKSRDEGMALVRSYEATYRQFLIGAEMLNYVRHLALAEKDPRNSRYAHNLATFCANKIKVYLDRAEQIPVKLDSVKLPADKVDTMILPGYTMANTVYLIDGARTPLTMSKPVHAMTRELTHGTYLLVVKSMDKYTLAAPSVKTTLHLHPDAGLSVPEMKAEGTLSAQTAWRKVFGVWNRATVELEVRATGMRDAHVDIVLQQWCPTDGRATGEPGMGGSSLRPQPLHSAITDLAPAATTSSKAQDLFGISLPQLEDEDLDAISGLMAVTPAPNAAAAHAVPPPAAHPAPKASAVAAADTTRTAEVQIPLLLRSVETNPAGLNCAQRLDVLRTALNEWPKEDTTPAPLPRTTESELHEVLSMPLPNPVDDADE